MQQYFCYQWGLGCYRCTREYSDGISSDINSADVFIHAGNNYCIAADSNSTFHLFHSQIQISIIINSNIFGDLND